MVNRCISSVHAYRSGACPSSLRAIMASSGEKKLRRPSMQDEIARTTTTTSVVTVMQTWNVHFHGVEAVERFLHGSWPRREVQLESTGEFLIPDLLTNRIHPRPGTPKLQNLQTRKTPRRVAILLRCMHPWLAAALVSIFWSHAVRVALIFLKLAGPGRNSIGGGSGYLATNDTCSYNPLISSGLKLRGWELKGVRDGRNR